jgi:hypothetical protein
MWDIKHKTSGWMPAPAKLDLTLTYLNKTHINPSPQATKLICKLM